MKIVFSVCKKSTNSSAANHQLNLMLMAILDREHYLHSLSYIIGTIGTQVFCVPLATSRQSRLYFLLFQMILTIRGH